MIDFNPERVNFKNIDRFFIKKSIHQYLKRTSSYFKGRLLDIGCGEMPYKNEILKNSKVDQYVGLDIHSALVYNKDVKPDYYWDGIKMPFSDESFDSGFATEVLEHCSDPLVTLKEICRVLKPGSPIIITVPFLWPTHESPHDYYRYTPFAIQKLLEESGFSSIEISCLGGWDASLAQMIGLWIKRRGFSKASQTLLFFILKPFFMILLKSDTPQLPNRDQNMFTNLGIIAWRK